MGLSLGRCARPRTGRGSPTTYRKVHEGRSSKRSGTQGAGRGSATVGSLAVPLGCRRIWPKGYGKRRSKKAPDGAASPVA